MSERGMYPLYSGWSNDLLNAEYSTLSHLDPEAWLKTIASLLRTNEPGPVKLKFAGLDDSEDVFLRETLGHEQLILRLMRYMSSEQLFSLLLSAEGLIPYASFVKKIRYDKLQRAYLSIAGGSVPNGGDLKLRQENVFNHWLRIKLGVADAAVVCPTLTNFIMREANFLEDRTFINAIKHGRARTKGTSKITGVEVQIDGAWQQVIPSSDGIWVEDWQERENVFQHVAHFESFDFRSEIRALYITSLIMAVIIESRTVYLQMLLSGDDSCKINVSLPNDITAWAGVSRIKNLPASIGASA